MSKILKLINKSVLFMCEMTDLVLIVSGKIQNPVFFFIVFNRQVFDHFIFYYQNLL